MRQPRARGRAAHRRRRASRSTGSCCCSPARTRRRRCPTSCRRRTRRRSAKGADEATRDALAQGTRSQRGEARRQQNATAPADAAPQTGMFSALADGRPRRRARQPRRARQRPPARAAPSAAQVGSVNATVGVDVQVQKGEDGPITLRGNGRHRPRLLRVPGAAVHAAARRHACSSTALPQINPTLDVTAERLIPNTGVTARIHITGTARAPQIALSSDPPLDEADILSLIVFNRSVNELGIGRDARRSPRPPAASPAASSPRRSGKSIGKALDVDLFEITTTGSGHGRDRRRRDARQAGQRQGVRAFRQQFGQRSFTEFMLEYQLAKFLRLDTQRRAGNERRRQPPDPAPRRARRRRSDLLFQLLSREDRDGAAA